MDENSITDRNLDPLLTTLRAARVDGAASRSVTPTEGKAIIVFIDDAWKAEFEEISSGNRFVSYMDETYAVTLSISG